MSETEKVETTPQEETPVVQEPEQTETETKEETPKEETTQEENPEKKQNKSGNRGRRNNNRKPYDNRWKTKLRTKINEDPEYVLGPKPKELKKPERADLQNTIKAIGDEIESIQPSIENIKKQRTHWRRKKQQEDRETNNQEKTDNLKVKKIYDKLKAINKKIKDNENFKIRDELNVEIKKLQEQVLGLKKGVLGRMRSSVIIERIENLEYTKNNVNLTATEEKKLSKELSILKEAEPDCLKLQKLEDELKEFYKKRKEASQKVSHFREVKDCFVNELKEALGEEEFVKRQTDRKAGKREYKKREKKEKKKPEEDPEEMVEDGGFEGSKKAYKKRSPKKRDPNEPRVYEEGDIYSPKIDGLFDKRRTLRDQRKKTFRQHDANVDAYRDYVLEIQQWEFASTVLEQNAKRKEEQKERTVKLTRKLEETYNNKIEAAETETKFSAEIEDCEYLISLYSRLNPENKTKIFTLKDVAAPEEDVTKVVTPDTFTGKLTGASVFSKRKDNTEYRGQMNVIHKKKRKRNKKKKGKFVVKALVDKTEENEGEDVDESIPLNERPVKLSKDDLKLIGLLGFESIPETVGDLAASIVEVEAKKVVYTENSTKFRESEITKLKAALAEVTGKEYKELSQIHDTLFPHQKRNYNNNGYNNNSGYNNNRNQAGRNNDRKQGGNGGRRGGNRGGDRDNRGGNRDNRGGNRDNRRRNDDNNDFDEPAPKPVKKISRIDASKVRGKVQMNDTELFPTL